MYVSLLFYHKCCTPQARSAELMSAILYNFMEDLQILRALGDLDGIVLRSLTLIFESYRDKVPKE